MKLRIQKNFKFYDSVTEMVFIHGLKQLFSSYTPMDRLVQTLKHTLPHSLDTTISDLTASANTDPPHKHTFMFTCDTYM